MYANKKYKIFKKCNCKCHYCNDDIIKIINDGYFPTLDHKNARIFGLDNSYENLVLACSFCNSSKQTKNETEMLEYMKPYREGLCDKYEISLFYKNK